MKKQQSDLEIDVYRNSMSNNDILSLRRKLAKRANQRLLRLERAQSKVTGEYYNEYGAATIAYEYLERQGRKRFRETKGEGWDLNSIRHEVVVLQGFLSSKSSTVVGQKSIEQKRIQSFEKGEWGTLWKTQGKRQKPIKFASNKEFYNFLNSDTFRGLVTVGFDSDKIVELYELSRDVTGGEDKTVDNMNQALEEFRKGESKATLKNLQKKLGVNLK